MKEIQENKKLRTEYAHMYVDSHLDLVDDVFTWTCGPVAKQFGYTLLNETQVSIIPSNDC